MFLTIPVSDSHRFFCLVQFRSPNCLIVCFLPLQSPTKVRLVVSFSFCSETGPNLTFLPIPNGSETGPNLTLFFLPFWLPNRSVFLFRLGWFLPVRPNYMFVFVCTSPATELFFVLFVFLFGYRTGPNCCFGFVFYLSAHLTVFLF